MTRLKLRHKPRKIRRKKNLTLYLSYFFFFLLVDTIVTLYVTADEYVLIALTQFVELFSLKSSEVLREFGFVDPWRINTVITISRYTHVFSQSKYTLLIENNIFIFVLSFKNSHVDILHRLSFVREFIYVRSRI